jgi:hypothetical protein
MVGVVTKVLAMRLRAAWISALVLGACTSGSDESAPVANTQVPLRYVYWLSGEAGTPQTAATPSLAYDAALAKLQQRCASSPRPRHECLGKTEIQILPYIWTQTTQDPIEQYGFVATFTRYIEGVNAVRAMFQTRSDARAADFRWSMSTMDAYLSHFGSDAKGALRDRNDLIKEARKLTERLTEQGEALHGAERAKLLRKRQRISEARAIIGRYRRAVVDRRAEYEALAAEYKIFQSAEPAEALRSIADRASVAELPAFPALQQELLALLSAENGAPQELSLRAGRLEGFFDSQKRWFDAEIASYRTFLADEGVATPDLTSRPIEILAGMQRYVADRQQRMNAAADKLIDGMKRRKSALVLLERDAQTRATLADATRAHAAAAFLSQATAQIQATWATQPSAAGVELVGARYHAVLALLQAASFCDDEDAPDWMLDGCTSYATNASKATIYLQNTLPRRLRRSAASFSTAGAPAAEVAVLENAVNAGDLGKAVLVHDSIARSLEVSP